MGKLCRHIATLAGLTGLALVGTRTGARGEAASHQHPFILWTRDDLAALRRKVETEPWAKATLERMLSDADPSGRCLAGLLRYAVLGDKQAGEKEKKELMRVIRSPIPRGGAQWITALRYDLLFDELSAEERSAFEEMARIYVRNAIFENAVFNPKIFNDSRRYSRYDARQYTRTNWLPNIIWPRKVSANLMALALGDEALIRKTWAAYGSWKWYFDEYLCDTGFYSEEFSKMGSTPGAMLLYCLGLERLGLGELGFGYTGQGGATMRGHIESLIHLGYPRVDVGSQRPHFPMVTIGDLRQVGSSQAGNLPSPAFQHGLVVGHLADGTGGNLRWRAHGAWGGTIRGNHAQWDGYGGFTPKMQIPLWFELGHARWPDAGFGYFLAQMRGLDEARYLPSLLFGIEPVDPAKVQPPPAPSAVWPERGLVMLRAEESPAYWESPAPAVCMRLATDYAHNVRDSFALVGFYALNRPIYLNRQVAPGYAQGWSRSIQSHCGVMVDGQEPRFTSATTVRKAFTPAVKFVAARSREVFPEADLTRSLMLTREYLLDVTRVASQRPRECRWFLHAPGEAAQPDAPGDRDWSVTAIQTCALDDPSQARLPKAWYDRRIGVRMAMLGAKGTTVALSPTPLPVRTFRDKQGKRHTEEMPSEVGGVTVCVRRTAPLTTFAALHEPFERGQHRIAALRRIQQVDDALAVAIVGRAGSGIDDRAMVRFGDDCDRPVTLGGDGESFTFAGFAFVRIGRDRVEATGGLRAATIRVQGEPKLVLNGKAVRSQVRDGLLRYASP